VIERLSIEISTAMHTHSYITSLSSTGSLLRHLAPFVKRLVVQERERCVTSAVFSCIDSSIFFGIYLEDYTELTSDPMIYGPGNEKMAVSGGVPMPEIGPIIMADEFQIKRTRQILVIILGVCLVSSHRARDRSCARSLS
jgi:hypothetical protein